MSYQKGRTQHLSAASRAGLLAYLFIGKGIPFPEKPRERKNYFGSGVALVGVKPLDNNAR
jgi:hypothetical protein